ncbi:MAG: hypothetical protein SFW36_10895 [Leptolyngbyaceae cyanobacterium bins.59]|nr:hypothetical protein [Leptolyngbyaceae cyanobacterium bins.59]
MVRIRSPQLPPTLLWLNCDRPLSLKELRGQIMLLVFWTYGCISMSFLTYNHKTKQVHSVTGECRTVAAPGWVDGIGADACFSDPSDRLYIADTNNHAIRCLNLGSLAVMTLTLPGLCTHWMAMVHLCQPLPAPETQLQLQFFATQIQS